MLTVTFQPSTVRKLTHNSYHNTVVKLVIVMGSCISWLCCSRSKSSKYSAAYRKDLCAKLLEESASELSAKAIVLIIKVKCIERLPQVQHKSSILGLPTYINCNCFLEMKLLREDTAISGVQLQRGLIGNFNFI